ncbi:methyltransferase, FkbM family [Tistlia consotensis]|uniref:Methyltransferase, FkbM family n=1 Tax=Tistlia consotensis USBA 355 TaxID=560819 RepID=A0A1Y6CMU2_9PROT|nr:FkbM family methyltransferase [Tistlia consotensis]SMF78419.1 methyltransferase, FkbM family [Tistlia consotensis USBA 355]SNS18454.1 methyltransferase, FkbM family [Tistlia consotensis]
MSLLSFLRHRLAPSRRRRFALGLLRGLPARERAIAVERLLDQPVTVDTRHGPIRFLNHGRGCSKRALSLPTKEPDSLTWIDGMAPGSIFWDIGANVGVLALYAARRGDLEVWAFEPAAVNFYSLAANCELNELPASVRCLQLGFGAENALADLHVSQLRPACSFTFREKPDGGPGGKQRKHYPYRQAVEIWAVDDFIDRHGLDCPNYLKIDVPGMTPEILAGARRTLARPELREVQIEVREQGPGGRRVTAMLAPLGFEVVRRHRKRDGITQGDLVFAKPRQRRAEAMRRYSDAAD